jgi:hypothetical protein
MKILCPNCNQVVELPHLKSRGIQMAPCKKCGMLVHATAEQPDGGTHIWDVHFEKPPAPKKDGCLRLLVLIFIALVSLIIIKACVDTNILTIGP